MNSKQHWCFTRVFQWWLAAKSNNTLVTDDAMRDVQWDIAKQVSHKGIFP